MEGFIYPNEANIQWDLFIVIYPYITGLVAGAFIVSSLYHVFGITRLKPVARFSLLTALAFLLVAPIPLTLHLGQPERAAEMFLRPNLLSAMSAFGYIWLLYLILVVVETWLVFRPDIVRFAKSTAGVKKSIYSILSLGVYDVSETALAADHKLIKFLALIGMPAASLLHGYVGFIFGAIKANPWWSTPLMPIIFLLSAVVSGMALLMVMYIVVTKARKQAIDHECLHTLGLWLGGGFLTVAVALEGLEVLTMLYESEESWDMLRQLITQKITVTYLVLQFGTGALLSLLILGVTEMSNLRAPAKVALRVAASSFILIGVFCMRWNVVIGGQLISKSLRGFTTFTPPLLGESGILMAAAIMVLPFVLLSLIVYLIPPWHDEVGLSKPGVWGLARAALK